jgi:hypothetical protein
MMIYSESIKDKIKNYSLIMFLIDFGLTGNKGAEMLSLKPSIINK